MVLRPATPSIPHIYHELGRRVCKGPPRATSCRSPFWPRDAGIRPRRFVQLKSQYRTVRDQVSETPHEFRTRNNLVPAISETLKSVDLQGWFMLMAPAGMPTDIIEKLSAEIARALNSAEVQERAPALGFDVGVGDAVTPEGAKRFLEAELAATGKVIQDLGIEPE
jgi:hypothetical protein